MTTNNVIATCAAHGCAATISAAIAEREGWVKTTSAKRGGGVAYLCPCHGHRNGDHSYSAENDVRWGKPKAHGFTFGIEMETHFASARARYELLSQGWMASYDCTCGPEGTEFKSPIFYSECPLPKKLSYFEKLLAEGEAVITESEGTHLHIGHVRHITPETMEYVRRFYHSLFVPLSNAMSEDRAACAAVFGRALGGWAQAIDGGCWATEHRNFVNTEHDHTLEWRVCKFVTAEQYRRAYKLARKCTEAVINNFVAHFNDPETAWGGMSQRDYRAHKANVAAQKMVKYYRAAVREATGAAAEPTPRHEHENAITPEELAELMGRGCAEPERIDPSERLRARWAAEDIENDPYAMRPAERLALYQRRENVLNDRIERRERFLENAENDPTYDPERVRRAERELGGLYDLRGGVRRLRNDLEEFLTADY